ncbi:MAG: 50S ribosomal protein L4 [Verrucomicrobiota bacterium]
MKATSLDFSAAESAFGVKLIANGIGTQALHDAVVGYQANRRQGNHATLTKGMVKGSGSKPYRQKGTGNARAGYMSSPIRRGGGVAHGPQPRDYTKIIPKKVKKLALKKAFSESAKSGKLFSSESLDLKAAKTKDLVSWIESNKLADSLLIITKESTDQLLLSARNLKRVEIMRADDVNAEDVLRRKHVVVFNEAMPVLAKRMN